MDKRMIDWKSLVIGILLGACIILVAAQSQKASDPAPQWQIATSNTTWVLNTATGDVWELSGQGATSETAQYKWQYSGKPSK
jgi:hypothetical protein